MQNPHQYPRILEIPHPMSSDTPLAFTLSVAYMSFNGYGHHGFIWVVFITSKLSATTKKNWNQCKKK